MKRVKLFLIATLILTVAFTACKSRSNGEAGLSAENDAKLPKNTDMGWGFEYDEQNRLVGYFTECTISYESDDSVLLRSDYGIIRLTKDGNTVNEEWDEFYGDVLDYSQRIITLNDEGYIVRDIFLGYQDEVAWHSVEPVESYTIVRNYEYQNGNLIKSTVGRYVYEHPNPWNEDAKKLAGKEANQDLVEYKYDDKKSPFYNSNTPKWVLQYVLGELSATKNNVTEKIYKGKILDGVATGTTYAYEYDEDGFPIRLTSTSAFLNADDYTSDPTEYEYQGTVNIKR